MKRTTGTCALCGYKSSKAGLTRHLKTCSSNHDEGTGKTQKLFHIRAEGAYLPLFWLDLEIRANAQLSDLDRFLRDVWLECCGHLSAFEILGTRYTVPYDSPFGDDFDEEDMNVSVGKMLDAGVSFSHEYDFGSTTDLKLQVKNVRAGKLNTPLRLLARNTPPEWECSVCGKTAEQIHTEEMWDSEQPFYCDEHAEDDEYLYLPVVNSPRMGVCGYTG